MTSFCSIDYKIENDRKNKVLSDNRYDIMNQQVMMTTPINNNLNSKLNVEIFDKYSNNNPIDNKVKQNSLIEFKNQDILNERTKEWAYSVKPDMNIRGMGLNRWYNLYKNPQENSIEHFSRIGMNSVLDVLDTHKSCKVTNDMLDGFSL